uniref:protein-L-isoaspartate(D-aspartate) O-methyltransferase n=1 Tax=Henneguya salminicola TaxID=69463 RepID=A0A6G3MHZ7_HENSL
MYRYPIHEGKTQSDLVKQLKAEQFIRSLCVEEVMTTINRKFFAPGPYPYSDCPHPIGYGAFIEKPSTHASILEILFTKLRTRKCRIMDIGTGSGYLALAMILMVIICQNLE